jgi:hypothetical protein
MQVMGLNIAYLVKVELVSPKKSGDYKMHHTNHISKGKFDFAGARTAPDFLLTHWKVCKMMFSS